jgi:hypothetical protein
MLACNSKSKFLKNLPDYIPMTATAAAPKVIEVNSEEWLSQLLLAM